MDYLLAKPEGPQSGGIAPAQVRRGDSGRVPRLDHISPTPPPETGPGIAAGPHPEPWILGQDLSQETQFRLQVLASIHALAQHLDHGVRERFQGLAMDSVGKLPADMEISVHDFRD